MAQNTLSYKKTMQSKDYQCLYFSLNAIFVYFVCECYIDKKRDISALNCSKQATQII